MLFLPTSCDKEMHERCESVKNFRDIAIASVGYDQRLAIWRPTSTLLSPDQNLCTQVTVNNFNFSQVLEHGKNSSDEKYDNDEDREEVTFSKFEEIVLARDALLMWIAGATIHVGDVCALDAILTCSDNSAMKSYNSENIPNSISREKCVSDISADKVDHVGARDGNISDVDIIVVGEGFQLLSFHV